MQETGNAEARDLRERWRAWGAGKRKLSDRDALLLADQLINDLAQQLDNPGAASQAPRQAFRDLVTAAAEYLESGDANHAGASMQAAFGRLEDLAVEALVAAGRKADNDFEAGAVFDLFWPEGLPPPAIVSAEPRQVEHFTTFDGATKIDGTFKLGRFHCEPREGEPSFLLLARDASAAGLVEMWCELRREFIRLGVKPREDMAKVIEGHSVAEAMRVYRASIGRGVLMTGQDKVVHLPPLPREGDDEGSD